MNDPAVVQRYRHFSGADAWVTATIFVAGCLFALFYVYTASRENPVAPTSQAQAGAPPGKPEVSEASPAQPPFDAAAVVKASASGNVQNGAETFKKCGACHDGTKGGPNKVGPNLWGVVGRPKASHEGFNYSDAMKAKGGNWTPEDIAQFDHSPKTFVPGTKMLFPGVSDPSELADLLAYLNTLK